MGALKPIEGIKKRANTLMLIAMGSSFFIFSLFGILGGTLFSSGVNIAPIMAILGILFVGIPAFIGFYTMKQTEKEMNNVIQSVRRVLKDESNKRSNVSFHIREDVHSIFEYSNDRLRSHYYIECVIETAVIPMGVAVPVEVSVKPPPIPPIVTPNAPYIEVSDVKSSEGKTTKERLQELEDIKSMITTEEYKLKKKEILEAL